ncbi:MAG: peptidylprolyl isomerase [Acidobacteria bacterium]|nr:peptidylprolyl isomerase [Acidobacteriota bacterium]
MKTWLVSLACAAGLFGQVPAPREPGLYVTFHTTMGDITARLFEKETPLTVRNFSALARGLKPWLDPKTNRMVKRPLYNGITFHRVMAGFMIQTGDPTASGAYYPGFTIKDEFVPTLKFDQPGRLAMANVGKPNTGSCQFFITEVPTPHLNGKHTIFGQVVEGQDVVNQIAHVPVRGEKPVKPVRITSVVFKREGAPPPAAAKKAARPAAKKK